MWGPALPKARLSRGLKERLRRLEGLMRVPLSVAKTSPPGWWREPIRSISASCRSRWPLRASVATPVSRTLRLALGCFEVSQNRFAALSYEGMSQAEHAALKIHVLPLEAQEFAFPHAGVDGQHIEGFEPIPARRFEQDLCLLPIEGRNLFALDLRRLDGFADIAGDQTVKYRLL